MHRAIVFLLALPLGAATFTVTVTGVTATQATLQWSHAGDCTVQVSEAMGLSPLVNDVNASLFAGSNSTTRAEALNLSPAHIFPVGKRIAQVALDAATYSRALQANTQHFFLVTCGADTGSGAFTTLSIPLGMTYTDLPPTVFPTIGATPVVDSQTGAKVKLAAPAANQGSNEAALGASGYQRVCNNTVVGPSSGYLCAFASGNGGPGVGYYLIPSTGETRFLGEYLVPSGASWGSAVSPNPPPGTVTYYGLFDNSNNYIVLKGTYTGDYSAQAPGATIPMTWTKVPLAGIDTLATLKLFNAAISSPVACGLESVSANYGLITCLSGFQDSYPYAVGVIDFSTGNAIAGRPWMVQAPFRYCGEHNYHFLAPGVPVVELQNHQLFGGGNNGMGVGGGPYTITLSAGIDAVTTTILVTGEPVANAGNLAMTAQVDDIAWIDNNELVRIITKVSSTQWTVERGWGGFYTAKTHAMGATGSMQCGGLANPDTSPAQAYWQFLADPLGTSVVINHAWPAGGHDDAGDNLHVTEGYSLNIAPIQTILAAGATNTITERPSFATAAPLTDGNAAAAHPSYNQVSPTNYFVDSRPLNGGNLYSDTHTALGGQLYKYAFAAGFPQDNLHRKILPTLSFTGATQLTDVSGPGSVITGGGGDSNKFCVAAVVNECVSGSAVGDTYGNIVGLVQLFCAGGDGPNPALHDWCTVDSPPIAQTSNQFGLIANRVGLAPTDPMSEWGVGSSRVLSRGFGPVRGITTVAKTAPDGSYVFFNQVTNGGTTLGPLLMLKMLPLTQIDSVDRSTFIRASLGLVPPTGMGIVSAKVLFGYTEFGTPSQYYCTTRRESCVVVSPTVVDANPFNFATIDTYSPLSCSTSCTITLPVAPMHTAYFHVAYLNGSGMEVAGDDGVAMESAIASLGGVTPIPPVGNSSSITGQSTLSGRATISTQ